MTSWIPISSALEKELKNLPMHEEKDKDEPEELEFEDDDGTMYIWDGTQKKYIPSEMVPDGSTQYKADDMVFPGGDDAGTLATMKRPLEADEAEAAAEAFLSEEGGGSKGGKNKKAKKMKDLIPGAGPPGGETQKTATWFELKQNTSVYASGLPLDVTVAEVSEVFSKYGVIKASLSGSSLLLELDLRLILTLINGTPTFVVTLTGG